MKDRQVYPILFRQWYTRVTQQKPMRSHCPHCTHDLNEHFIWNGSLPAMVRVDFNPIRVFKVEKCPKCHGALMMKWSLVDVSEYKSPIDLISPKEEGAEDKE